MRSAAVLALLVLLPGAAQGAWGDPVGDYEVGVTVGAQWDESSYKWTNGSQTHWYPFADIVGAGVSEPSDDSLAFEVGVADKKYAGNEPHKVVFAAYDFSFLYHGTNKSVVLVWHPDGGRPNRAELRTFDAGRPRADETFPLEETPQGFRAVIPKERLRDRDLIPVRAGDTLEQVRVRSSTGMTYYVSPCTARDPPDCWRARDFLGPPGFLGSYDVVRAPRGVGHLALTSPAPFRSSNGLATTYLFELVAHNLASESDTALVGLGPFPSEWRINTPTVVEVPGDSKVTFPVAVTVPFTHLHGNETYVNVTLTSQREPDARAAQAIGVVWTKVPQPSGHHAYLHAHAANGDAWVNTLEDDAEADAKATIRTRSYSVRYGFDRVDYVLRYGMLLQPALQSGLDFDLTRKVEGRIVAKFDHETTPTGTFTLSVIDADYKPLVVVATQKINGPKVGKGTEAAFDVAAAVDPKADRVPFEEGNNLLIEFELVYSRVREPTENVQGNEPALPVLVPEPSTLQLPLVEFLEVPDEALLSSLTRFSLVAKTATYKMVNPGDLAAFGVEVQNAASADESVDWRLIGANTDWAAVEPRATRLPAEGRATVLVTVRAPEDAEEGEAAEMLLVGQSRDDKNAQVFVRIVAQVTRAEDLESEEGLANRLRGDANASRAGVPGLPAAAALLVLAGGVARRRRR